MAILLNYSKAPYFKTYKDLFKELYLSSNQDYLSEINYKFIIEINKLLDIKTKISWSSSKAANSKTERIIEICKQAHATEYISGPAAKNYIDETLLAKANINLTWMDYSGYPQYNQLFPPFEHRVSIIDLIFNEGAEAKNFLKSYRNG